MIQLYDPARTASIDFDRAATLDEPCASSALGPIAALIPAYNEYRFIGSIVLAARRHVDLVVVVDDGSSDDTAAIAEQAGAVVIRHQSNQGKAAAINSGFAFLRARGLAAVVMLDGDGQHCAEDIPTLVAPVLAGQADIVIGSRFLDVRSYIPAYRQIGQHGLTMLTNLASGVAVSDSQSGFRALSQRALEALCFTQGGFSIESEMQFQLRDYQLQVAEAPVKVVYAEPAKRNPLRHGLQVLNGILNLFGQTRPLFFFGFSGLLLFSLGASLGLYVIQIYALTQRLALGYALVTLLLSTIGSVLFFAGIILHSTRSLLLETRRAMISASRYVG